MCQVQVRKEEGPQKEGGRGREIDTGDDGDSSAGEEAITGEKEQFGGVMDGDEGGVGRRSW